MHPKLFGIYALYQFNYALPNFSINKAYLTHIDPKDQVHIALP